VTLEKGARYVEWQIATLDDALSRSPTLRAALEALFNADMAGKVARA